MLLLVGLGNPGAKYENNRHNIGFMAVDEIVRRHVSFGPWKSKFQGLVAEGKIGGEKVLALKPQTFMNKSGKSVSEAQRFFKIAPDQVLVFYDELDLAPGKVKVKRGGGNAGHNGLRSIDAFCPKDYWKIRLGIGHPGDKNRVMGHVLGDFSRSDQDWLSVLLPETATHLEYIIRGEPNGFTSRVMQAYVPPKPAAKDTN